MLFTSGNGSWVAKKTRLPTAVTRVIQMRPVSGLSDRFSITQVVSDHIRDGPQVRLPPEPLPLPSLRVAPAAVWHRNSLGNDWVRRPVVNVSGEWGVLGPGSLFFF